MKHLLSLALAFLLGASLSAGPDTDKLHLVLLVGQSNMAGRAKIEETDQKELPSAWLWNKKTGEWETASPPYNRHSPNGKGANMQRLNPGPSFAQAYLKKNPGVELGIICMARGGTSIEEWKKGKEKPWPLYDTAVEASREALKEGGTLAGILWHQGESNSGRSEGYPVRLEELVENFRTDLNAPEVPFVFSQLGSWGDKYATFNKMIIEQPKKIQHSACITTEGLKSMDNAHFDSHGQRELGKRYAAALDQLQKK